MKSCYSYLVLYMCLLVMSCNHKKSESESTQSEQTQRRKIAPDEQTASDSVQLTQASEDTIAMVMHTPLHPQNNIPINFSLRANSRVGISKVVLYLYEYELSKGTANENTRVIKRRTNGTWGRVDSLEYANAREVQSNFTHKKGFPANTYLKYKFLVYNKEGDTTSRTIRMQAGTSPFGDREILLYSAASDNPANTFDLCFVPSTSDYAGKMPQFRSDLAINLYGGYLVNNMVRSNLEDWSFYYTPKTVSIVAGTTPPEPPFLALSSLDFYAFIHTTDFTDQAGGNRFSTEFDNRGTVMHETGHAVFDLSDEYKGSRSAHAACNVFVNKEDCKTANGGVDCRSFTRKDGKVRYSIDPDKPSPNCVMNGDGNTVAKNYRARCMECITEVYNTLNNATASITADYMLDSTATAKDRNAASKQYLQLDKSLQSGRILVIKITNDAAGWRAEVLGVTNGSPTLSLSKDKDFAVFMLSNNKRIAKSFMIDDPRVSYIDEGPDNNSVVVKNKGEKILRLPYNLDVTTLEISGTSAEKRNQVVRIDISSQVRKFMK